MQEYQAGTDPNDSNSVFEFSVVGGEDDLITIDFKTEVFNRYLVQSSEFLTPESWVDIRVNFLPN